MKKTFLSILFLSIALCGFAKPIDLAKALSIAQEFCQRQGGMATRTSRTGNLSLAYQCTDSNIKTRAAGAEVYYYVFNKPDNQGFIIISGDDRVRTVLGYSDKGDYSLTNQPDNFKTWMETYKEAIKDLMASPEKSLPVIKEVTTRTNTSVAPLLGQIAWKQGDPCNQMCPMDGSRRSLTGCVATAMAQIMKYHRWPVTGTGSYHYNASLTVDFSQSTYQWDLMLDNYDGYSTSFSKEAVALLMRDCGMGSHTQYSYNNSSATFYDAKNAFKNHFGYDTQNLQVRDRRNDSYDWTNWIKADLNNNLPVCYGGKKGGGGHAFVCDGYDTNNLFHINWGWGGNSNGYFSLDELNGYTDGQQIITGIQKPGGTPPPPAEPYKLTYTSVLGPDKWSIYSGEEITFTIKIRNAGGEYNGQAKLACKQNGNEISSFTQDLVIAKGEEKTITLTKRLTLSPGSYKAYVYVYDQKENEPWFTLKPFTYSNCTFTVAEGTSIDSPDYSTLSIYPNPATSKLGILTNDNVKFIRVTDLTGKAMLTLSPSQEEKEISISIDELNAGTYLLQVTTDNGIKTSKFIKQ